MRILVSGSEGYIGSKLVKALQEEGHEVLRFDRKLNSYLKDFKDVDLVYHFAAQADVQYSLTHPYQDANDNILLTTKFLEEYPNVRIIYPASASSLDIKSPYGLSKKVGEDYIKLLHKDYVILRLPNVYGSGGRGVIDKFREMDTMTIFGDGTATRTIVHVDDVVTAFVDAKNWDKGEYQLGGQVISINEIADKLGKPRVYKPAPTGDIFASVLKNTAPNWRPTILL